MVFLYRSRKTSCLVHSLMLDLETRIIICTLKSENIGRTIMFLRCLRTLLATVYLKSICAPMIICNRQNKKPVGNHWFLIKKDHSTIVLSHFSLHAVESHTLLLSMKQFSLYCRTKYMIPLVTYNCHLPASNQTRH